MVAAMFAIKSYAIHVARGVGLHLPPPLPPCHHPHRCRTARLVFFRPNADRTQLRPLRPRLSSVGLSASGLRSKAISVWVVTIAPSGGEQEGAVSPCLVSCTTGGYRWTQPQPITTLA